MIVPKVTCKRDCPVSKEMIVPVQVNGSEGLHSITAAHWLRRARRSKAGGIVQENGLDENYSRPARALISMRLPVREKPNEERRLGIGDVPFVSVKLTQTVTFVSVAVGVGPTG